MSARSQIADGVGLTWQDDLLMVDAGVVAIIMVMLLSALVAMIPAAKYAAVPVVTCFHKVAALGYKPVLLLASVSLKCKRG